ncbi:hypothetical protein LTR66_014095, partial [Elasticomyces elasticus]
MKSGVGGLAKLVFFAQALLRHASAIGVTNVPSPNLDLSQLGRVAVAGDFDSISLYTYEGQNENAFSTNGSQALLTRYPSGSFQSLAVADGYVQTMCPFVLMDGSLAGVIVGGNFTSLGGVEAQGIALWNPNTTEITPLPGLSGRVSSVYCDPSSATVYVGGSFSGGNSTNAIAWTTGWTNLPFAGFNGPVTSITKGPNKNIIFGGAFTGLGNTTTPKNRDGQVVNLSSGNITAGASTATVGYNDPHNIVCKIGSQDGPGNTWLLADRTPGYWQVNFQFGFNPTKLRLYNTKQDGRGTKTFRVTALPIDGIMNMTYTDANGNAASCSDQCPLSQDSNTYQDFHFANSIGMNGFRVDVSDWYGNGGGLSGIEMFQDDIYSFAIESFNEPKCDGVSQGASATTTGSWAVMPSASSTSEYLSAVLTGSNISSESASVVFQPDIKQSGNYSITVHTPGCMQDNSCATRGRVNITGSMTATGPAFSTELFQTNNYDKYDQVYYGYVDVNSDTFRPQVTLTPASGQAGPLTVVAQRVRFELLAPMGGLNGLFEFNPNEATVSTDFSQSAINRAGQSLHNNALINQLAVVQDATYVAGNFTADSGINNICFVKNANATALPGSGLNSEVLVMYQNGSLLYVGGNFTNTGDNASTGLSGVAAFSVPNNAWQPLGAGVDGIVWDIVPLQLNITDGLLADVITISGNFGHVNAFGKNGSFSTHGFAVWVPGYNNWLHNLGIATISIAGQLVTQTKVPGFTPLFAGSISSQALGLSDAVALTGSGQPTLQSLGLTITPKQVGSSPMQKRAINGQNVTGVVTGKFYHSHGLNITILGGHFTASASNGSTINNLVFLNDTTSRTVTGVSDTLDTNSVFLALDTQDTTLFAGGTISGT